MFDPFFEFKRPQDFGFYGNNVGGQGSKLGRNMPRSVNGGSNEDASTPPACSRSSSMRKNGSLEGMSPNELSPGLLDLHSFDTELISEVCIHFSSVLKSRSTYYVAF